MKNLCVVGGVSLVARAAISSFQSKRVTRTIGSTDSAEIAEALRDAGAEVPWLRPSDLSEDDTPDSPVFLHVLDALRESEQYVPDIVVNVRPTAPFRTGAHIDGAIQALLSTPDAVSVKSVSLATEHPYKMWTLDGTRLEAVTPVWRDARGGNPDVARQQLPPVYLSNGAVDAVWTRSLTDSGTFHPGLVAGYVMDEIHALDVDTAADLTRAESLLSAQRV